MDNVGRFSHTICLFSYKKVLEIEGGLGVGDFIKNKKMIKLILFLKKICDRLRHKFSYKVFIALKYFCFVTSFY